MYTVCHWFIFVVFYKQLIHLNVGLDGGYRRENNELNIQNKGTTKRKRKQSETIKNKKILNRKNRHKQASKLKNAENIEEI